MNKGIQKTLLLGLALSLVTSPAFAADNASTEESVGVGVGAVIGGVAGGPVGFIIGAAIGAKLGDEFYERNEEVDSLSASLNGSQNQVSSLERDIAALQGEVRSKDDELQQARELAKPELLSLLKAGIEMDLLFRTDEDTLSDSTGGRLEQLAASLAANPDIQIHLDGYADERGDEIYNQDLSARRVAYVRDVLVAAGIPANRISIDAHGESAAAEQNADSFALERRVSLTLYVGETPSFASNPR
ncbi:MAG: OmpA family protein [Gammaproteobacteria bacterium]|nr:OmpA family protein [Gammaproteobacteria bacterium]